jgi:hypothetical protein
LDFDRITYEAKRTPLRLNGIVDHPDRVFPGFEINWLALRAPDPRLENNDILIMASRGQRAISPGNVTRLWDTTLEVADKLRIHIAAGDHVGGNVVVRYLSDGQILTVVPPRDYVYPIDIRIDRDRSLLYVETDGYAAGIRRETWLYAYDLPKRKVLSHVLIDPAVLPSECPIIQ